jgi:Flp pilus assembly protein TadB
MPADPRRDHGDDRPDLGLFGRSVTVLIVVLLVAAVAVAVLVDPLVWVLAAVMVGVLVLWTRLVRS